MREFDHDGLLLCKIQAKLFEQSLDKVKCSSEVFIRRYMNSEIVKTLDSTGYLDDNATIDNIFEEIEKEYGVSEYGINKYDNEEIYWIGYIYRYFSYTYELSSSYIYKLIKPGELKKVYYPYHTMDPKMAIERMLESRNIDLTVEGLNKRAYEIIKKVYKEHKIHLINVHDNANAFNETRVNYGKTIESKKFNINQNNENIGKIGIEYLNDNSIHLFIDLKKNLPDKYFTIFDILKEVLKYTYDKKIITFVKKKDYKIEPFIDQGFKLELENDLHYKLIKQ